MGRNHAYIRFNPDTRVFWTSHTRLPALDDDELDTAYRRAYKFLVERTKILVRDHKWKDIDFGNRQLLLSLTKEGYINKFTLPHSFFPFLNISQFSDWKGQFEAGVFEAHNSLRTGKNDLFIAGPPALSDIFYILQSIAPGMLVLGCKAGEDDMGDLECTRGLPPATWVEEHAQMLLYIFGSDQAYKQLFSACRDESRACSITYTWSDDDASECHSTGSTMVEESSDDGSLKADWSKIPAFDGRRCGSECGGCNRFVRHFDCMLPGRHGTVLTSRGVHYGLMSSGDVT